MHSKRNHSKVASLRKMPNLKTSLQHHQEKRLRVRCRRTAFHAYARMHPVKYMHAYTSTPMHIRWIHACIRTKRYAYVQSYMHTYIGIREALTDQRASKTYLQDAHTHSCRHACMHTYIDAWHACPYVLLDHAYMHNICTHSYRRTFFIKHGILTAIRTYLIHFCALSMYASM
jgi:hypothetical protein